MKPNRRPREESSGVPSA
ncbi:TPA_asm: hypothetical protein PROPHIFSQJ01-1_85 [Mycobacterium phage prophiFSQJ01-1]|nr:TPA_asm: hypothetical protein PROPHIFSQJ01-1_85 [Mycobacterium phage prophiFSQJ01-1]